MGSCDLGNEYRFLEISGNNAYVFGDNEMLKIIDISDAENPINISSFPKRAAPWGTYVDGDYAYMASSAGELIILDVSDPEEPSYTGRFSGLIVHHGIVARKHIAYLQTCHYFYTIDISNPANPVEIAHVLSWTCDTRGLDIYGPYAYIVDSDEGIFKIIDIQDPHDPRTRGTYEGIYFRQGYHIDIAVVNGLAYVPSNVGLQIINVMDPDGPYFVSCYDSLYLANKMQYGDGYLFLANEFDGLRVLDLSNPTNPDLFARIDSVRYYDVHYKEGFIYALTRTRLDIYSIEPLEVKSNGSLPDGIFSLSAFPNPFNPSATINFTLPEQSGVRIAIYNVIGQKVTSLFEGDMPAGNHSIIWDASVFPSGVYIARLEADSRSENVKMVLLK